ncbi:unnamed protein product [Coregonus sp. 'balchen']|nr:unnamed protein product [Coregonus sp. 'balchen']
MATSNLSPLEEALSCPVCCDIFKEPVILSCGHSFCKACLEEAWSSGGSQNCPVCRQMSSRDHPPQSLALFNACEFLQKERERSLRGANRQSSCRENRMCVLNTQELSLFCVKEEELICIKCVSDHTDHSFCSITKAAKEKKEEINTSLEVLQVKLDSYTEDKYTSEKMVDHIKTQAQQTESQIKEEYEKLQQFLREEEARLARLKEEEEEKNRGMEERIEGLSKVMSSLSDTIKYIEEKLEANDLIFLQSFKTIYERAQNTPKDPEVSGALIDVAKHLGNLKFRVWEKMQGIIRYTPVVMDPNTAHPTLILSEDLTGLKKDGGRQDLPKNPERFEKHLIILGSEGFTSGHHCWEVDVGDNDNWMIGVARESVIRKEVVTASNTDGFWYVCSHHGKYPPSQYYLKIQRIRVVLDCDEGQVSFTDTVRNKHIHTYKHRLTERMFPYFCTGESPALQI